MEARFKNYFSITFGVFFTLLFSQACSNNEGDADDLGDQQPTTKLFKKISIFSDGILEVSVDATYNTNDRVNFVNYLKAGFSNSIYEFIYNGNRIVKVNLEYETLFNNSIENFTFDIVHGNGSISFQDSNNIENVFYHSNGYIDSIKVSSNSNIVYNDIYERDTSNNLKSISNNNSIDIYSNYENDIINIPNTATVIPEFWAYLLAFDLKISNKIPKAFESFSNGNSQGVSNVTLEHDESIYLTRINYDNPSRHYSTIEYT